MTPSKTTIAAFADRDLRGESMKKKRIPPWKHDERLLRKAKSRKWWKKQKEILAMLESKQRYEPQRSRAEYIK